MQAAPLTNKELLADTEAAMILRLSPWTLRSWRCKNRGPKFVRIGGRVMYPARDLAAWLRNQPTGGGLATNVAKEQGVG